MKHGNQREDREHDERIRFQRDDQHDILKSTIAPIRWSNWFRDVTLWKRVDRTIFQKRMRNDFFAQSLITSAILLILLLMLISIVALAIDMAVTGWQFVSAAALGGAALTILLGVYLQRRSRHAHRLRMPHCLTCGYNLRGTPTDALGWGRCPECALAFHRDYFNEPTRSSDDRSTVPLPNVWNHNQRARLAPSGAPLPTPVIRVTEQLRALGEPFDDTRVDHLRQIFRYRASVRSESRPWWMLLVCGGSLVIAFLFLLTLTASTTAGNWRTPMSLLAVTILVTLSFVGGIVVAHSRSSVRKILDDEMCLECDYPLKGASTGEDGWGRCPECGTPFSIGWYRTLKPRS